jgi:hypothetical protein
MSLSVPPGGGPPIENPEIALPFSFDLSNNSVELVEQSGETDIANRIWIVLSYEPGMFHPDPDFGVPSPAFAKGGADLTVLEKAIRKWVPDSNEIIERNPDWFKTLVDQITIRRDLSNPV